MNQKIIYTEDPIKDIWDNFLLYTCDSQIKKYLSVEDVSIERINIIKSAIQQSKEYFELSEKSTFLVKPLLEYYCFVNLLNGCCNLICDKVNQIKHHGMVLCSDDSELSSLANIKVKFAKSRIGGINIFHNCIENNEMDFSKIETLSISDLFLSIPEIYNEANDCFGSELRHCYKCEIINDENGDVLNIEILGDIKKEYNNLQRIQAIKDNYILQMNGNNEKYIIARKKYQCKDSIIRSVYGEPFILSQIDNKYLFPQWEIYYIILFALSSLCRYYPVNWNNIIYNGANNEKILLEKFLRYSNRVLPNILISKILQTDILYVNSRYQSHSNNKQFTEKMIKDIVYKTIKENEYGKL